MTTPRLHPAIASCLLVTVTLCSTSALADVEGTLNLYLNGGRYWFDSDRLDGTPFEGLEPEDSSGGGAGFGFNVTDRWALEGVFDYFSVNLKDSDEDVDVDNYRLDLLYQFAGRFCGNFCWQPYVAFGAGEIRVEFKDDFDNDFDWHDRQTMVNLGLGIKYRLGPRWQVRADARAFQGVEHGGLDGYLNVSFGYQWGEDVVILRDNDGDGVYDGADECPQTPYGVVVEYRGCPLDSDGDGVPDYLDQCPGTPLGMSVSQRGCPI